MFITVVVGIIFSAKHLLPSTVVQKNVGTKNENLETLLRKEIKELRDEMKE